MTWLLAILLVTAGLSSAQKQSAGDSRGELKLATPLLEKSCALERTSGESCYYLARNLHALGEFEAARSAFDWALKAAPQSFIARVYRGAALNYMALGMDTEAERDFRRAITSSSAVGDVRVDLGAFLFRQGRLAEASKLLEEAVQANPESARANLESGRVLLHLNQLEAARGRLEQAVHRNPADWNAHLLLGRAYQRLGRTTDAERQLQLGESGWRSRGQP